MSKQSALRRWVETSAVAHRLTSRFIAGNLLADAINTAHELNRSGFLTSLDYLGENVTTVAQARANGDAYVQALQEIGSGQLHSTISMKVTALGLDISEAECLTDTARLVEEAAAVGSVVEMDMEASAYVDRNLKVVREMHAQYGHVRSVIQAYLYRSESDVRALCAQGVPIRLCKGAYLEPPNIAWPEKKDVDENYRKLVDLLMEKGTYPAIATHDPLMVQHALDSAQAHRVPADAFEFQMLYGVARNLQKDLVSQGFRVRIYLPYGDAWYPYFMRRLAERPANVVFLLRNLLGKT